MVDKTGNADEQPREINDRGGVFDPGSGNWDPRILDAYVEQKVAAALAKSAADHEQTIAAMRMLIPDHTVPQHAGGPGITRLPAWSLAQQEASQRGDLKLLETGTD